MSSKETESSEKSGASAEALSRALGALRSGEAIVFPTETFYGLGADAFDGRAVDRVVSLKGRDPQNPIPLIIADLEMLAEVVQEVSLPAQRLIDRFWPGPLTLVLPARKGLSKPLVNRGGKVGVRISGHPVATRLAGELGHPLTATSANPTGKKPARTVQEGRAYFGRRIPIFLDGGMLTGRKGSTVVEVTDDQLKIIREGEIGSKELGAVLGGFP